MIHRKVTVLLALFLSIWIVSIMVFVYREYLRHNTPSPTPSPTLSPTLSPTPSPTTSPTPSPTTAPMNVLIILGNEPLDDNTPTIDTMKRVDAAAAFYNKQTNKENTILIFTGGPTAGKKTEASVMAEYAMRTYHIPRKNIILEEKARSTQENAILVAKIIEKNITLHTAMTWIVSKKDHLDWAMPLFKKAHVMYKNAKGLPSFIDRKDSIADMNEYLKTHENNQRVRWRMQNLIKGIQGID